MLVNTNEFCREAQYFTKHGRYPDGTTGSIEWDEYWDIQHNRCINGYSVGGMHITGEYYFYLNFNPIIKVERNKKNKFKIDIQDFEKETNLVQADRIKGFPDFWDLDYEYFLHLEKAKRLGKNVLWLKGRGCGASYKGGGLISHNYHFVRESKSYAIADLEDYLIDDGILTKFLMTKAFLNEHTEFGKSSDFKAAEGELKWRASYSDINDKEEKGYLSEVMGVVLNRDWQKARGKRGQYVLFEEGGKFPNMDKAWKAVQDSVEEGTMKYGTMIGFGTGGTNNKDFGPMSKMFYNPEAFNILPCKNIWDEGLGNTTCGFFTPAYWHVDFKDKEGNTNKEEAKEFFKKRRERTEKSPDPMDLKQEKAEQPFCPQDAILIFNDSGFPSEAAKRRRNELIASHKANVGVVGKMLETSIGVSFEPSDEVKPLTKWKYPKKEFREGAVVIYESPFKLDGEVPKHLYIIGHDPYDKDDSEGPSVGAAYVYKMSNTYGGTQKKVVATYFGRPRSLDEYNYNLFCLARYYNAKIGFENDRGDVIGYAKRKGLLSYLASEFKLAYDDNLRTSVASRKYGMHMGSGKLNKRKKTGDSYLTDMLTEVLGVNMLGTPVTFLNTIECISTLEEIQEYNPEEGNFDRISALRVLIYHIKELEYKNKKPKDKKNSSTNKKLFKKELF